MKPPKSRTGEGAGDIDREHIAAAYQRTSSHIRRTPIIAIEPADLGISGVAAPVTLKLEYLQHAGSFKARGAFTAMLSGAIGAIGVAAASGGNHGVAVAFAARRLGHKATIFVPEISSPAKIRRIRDLGADLVVGGSRYADALAACESFTANSGATGIHAYDAPETLLGQGGVGFELEMQAPGIDTLLVAVGGGGLIGGIAAWYEHRIRIVAVEPETSNALSAAFAAGGPVDVEVSGIAADSLGARRIGTLMWPLAERFVHDAVVVSDAAITAAQRQLWERVRVVAEPGGATALAALTAGVYRPARDERVAVLVCGANTDAVRFD
ncbi:MAG: threonine/serine dehydratase [Hyphomicrobiaceae bacterium]